MALDEAIPRPVDDRLSLATEICQTTPLDLGIVRAVKILRDEGLHTYESCEGGEGHCYAVPTVRFYGPPSDGWRALAVCKAHGLPVRSLRRSWDVDDDEPSGPYWQIEFLRRLD